MARVYLSTTTEAAAAFGFHLAATRRQQRRTAAEIAERASTTRVTLLRIERGDPTVALGLYFEVAMVLGVPLFGREGRELAELAAQAKRDLALLPSRVDARPEAVDDDF
ncbi:MAG: helix-turn-helix transcriptional regulator [Acidimicrobiales bacterium]